MPRLSVRLDLALLGRVVTDPRRLRDLSGSQLSDLIDAAERARLLGWLLAQLDAQSVPVDRTVWLTDRLLAVRARAGEYERAVRWEIDRIFDRGDEMIILARLSRRITPDSEARLEDRALSS